MTGVAEILILILLIVAVLILPGLLKPSAGASKNKRNRLSRLTPVVRAGIILTLVYPIGTCLYFRPWEDGQLVRFLSYGIFPVCLAWSAVWIISGRQKK